MAWIVPMLPALLGLTSLSRGWAPSKASPNYGRCERKAKGVCAHPLIYIYIIVNAGTPSTTPVHHSSNLTTHRKPLSVLYRLNKTHEEGQGDPALVDWCRRGQRLLLRLMAAGRAVVPEARPGSRGIRDDCAPPGGSLLPPGRRSPPPRPAPSTASLSTGPAATMAVQRGV